MSLKIVLVNACGRKNHDMLLEYLLTRKVDIAIISEAINVQPPKHLEGAESFTCANGSKRGVAIVKLNRGVKVRTLYIADHHIVCKVLASNIMIDAWYVRPGTAKDAEFRDLGLRLKKRAKRCLQIGDFNAASSFNAGSKTDARGKHAERMAILGGYTSLNVKNIPTFTKAQTTPDWVLATNDLLGEVDFSVWEDDLQLDHRIIEITVKQKARNRETVERIKPARFLEQARRLVSSGDAQSLAQVIAETSQKSTTARTNNRTEISENAKYLINELKKNKKRASEWDDPYERDKRRRSIMTALRTEEKRHNIRRQHEVCKGITKENISKKCIKAAKTAKVEMVELDGQLITGREAADLVLRTHFPEQEEEAYTLKEELEPDDPPITVEEIYAAFKLSNKDSAPGEDGVSYSLLLQLFQQQTQLFLNQYNDWLRTGIFPSENKTSMLILLSKINQPPKPELLRPIGLLNTNGRIFERIIDERIMWHMEHKMLFAEAQHGYRENRSCTTALTEITIERNSNRDLGRVELVAQLDVKKAFTRLKHSSIIEAIIKYNCPGNTTRLIHNYLQDRKVAITLDGERAECRMTRGVVQGSVLGPHLFIIAVNDAIRQIEGRGKRKRNLKVVVFADDITLIINGNTIKETEQILAQELNELEHRLGKLGLELAKEKTEVMLGGVARGTAEISLGTATMRTKEQLKIMGILIDQEPKSGSQLERIEAGINEAIKSNNKILNKYNKISADARRILALTVLRPIATYGAYAWFDPDDPEIRRRLKIINQHITTNTTMAPTTASYLATAVLSNFLPLHLELEKELKSEEARRDEEYKGIQIEKRASKRRLHPAEWPKIRIEGYITTDEQAGEINADMIYYTDGSRCTEEKSAQVGAAVVIKEKNHHSVTSMKLPSYATVFQAEATAIKVALELFATTDYNTAAIVTDSLSALEAATDPRTTDPIIAEIQDLHSTQIKKGRTITYYHVKAHQGVTLNEEADKAAKAAPIEGDEEFVPQTRREVNRQIKKEMEEKFLKEWHDNNTASTLRKFIQDPYDKIKRHMHLNVNTARVYTGHGPYKGEMGISGRTKDTSCFCGKAQTVEHLFTDCPLFVEGNVTAAASVGLAPADIFAPWTELRMNRKLHEYIKVRAESINKTLYNVLYDN